MERQDRQAPAPDSLTRVPRPRHHVPHAAAVFETDALIVGAGPVGLFQAFQLGLHGIHAHIVDALPSAGGQCAQLYGDSPIYDIPGIPACTGLELTERLLRQVAPFSPQFHFNQVLAQLSRRDDGRWDACTDQGVRFATRTLFIASGVGAFLPRKLTTTGLAQFEGTQIHYRVDRADIFHQRRVLVVGGDEAALRTALQLCTSPHNTALHVAAHVSLLHRRDSLQASAETLSRWQAACDAGLADFHVGQITGFSTQDTRLSAVHILDDEAREQALPVDHILVQLGLSPKLGPVAQWGLAMERKQLVVDPSAYATSEPGIYAVGDINTYPGKRKLILCGFHEATLAAFGARAWLYPDRPDTLEYTTSSKHLHAILGVANR